MFKPSEVETVQRFIIATFGSLAVHLLVFVGLVSGLSHCAVSPGSTELRARTALDAIADIVDPAYQLAMQGCVQLEDQAMTLGELDARTPAQTEAAIGAISSRCHVTRDAFDKIRSTHDQAVAYVEDGKFDQALQQLEEMREAWRLLRERVTDDHS